MVNQVVLVGRLTRDADLKYSQSGTAVANFTLAVNRIKKGEVDFLNIVTFEKTAESVANYTKKGQLVAVSGSIQTRNYEKDGKKVYVTEILGNSVQFLESSKGPTDEKPQISDLDDTDDLPF